MKTFIDVLNSISNKEATTPTRSVRARRGKYSVGIVCSSKNGKRVTLSALLAEKLKLDDTVFFTVYREDRLAIISSHSLNSASFEATLKGKGMKIAYKSSLVHFLIDTFEMDFGPHVSTVFHDIVFNDDPDDPQAILSFPEHIKLGEAVTEAKEVQEDEKTFCN
jgi:hypothetical protein